MKPRRIFSALLLSLGLILSSPATVTLTVFGQSDEYTLAIDAD